MIVSRSQFNSVVEALKGEFYLSLDTETTGLRMYHGDRLFSVIIATAREAFYFNFLPYAKFPPENVLTPTHLQQLQVLFAEKNKVWFIQNAANFDMPILGVEGLTLAGDIHCTKAIGRVEYNDHIKGYSLDEQLKRIGDKKDDKVKLYIEEHKLWTKVEIPGKKTESKNLHFDRVPPEIIIPYGEQDAFGTYKLGLHQVESIREQDKTSSAGATLSKVAMNERRLQHTIYRMKHQGVLIDREYCTRAAKYEHDRASKASDLFKRECGREYASSPKLFAEVFQSERELWEFTEKNNPSFESGTLKKFANPAAGAVLSIRDAKSKADFYEGFLYHADKSGRIHPNFNPDGATHGRFSSSEPNFQNLTAEEDEETLKQEFIVRRAIIPTPGFIFIMPDYDQMEYRFMLEMACRIVGEESPLVKLVKGGLDVHQATANVATETGVKISRYEAKTSNFLTLYGGGNKKLADGLNCSVDQARAIRNAIFTAAPEIRTYIEHVMSTAEKRGYIVNWLGRRCHFPNRAFAYRAPNYHCSGGCADIVKVAMNRVDELLLGHKSRMVMTVHDELPIEVHEDEVAVVPGKVQEIMEDVFKSVYMPLTTGMEWSSKSLGDKTKGFPV